MSPAVTLPTRLGTCRAVAAAGKGAGTVWADSSPGLLYFTARPASTPSAQRTTRGGREGCQRGSPDPFLSKWSSKEGHDQTRYLGKKNQRQLGVFKTPLSEY